MKRNDSPTYHMTIRLTGNRRNKQAFHTIKSARHYARSIVNNSNVVEITLTGADIVGSQQLYDASAPREI